MLSKLFKAIVKLFLAAMYMILAMLSLLSVALIAVAWYLGSFWGVLIYSYSLAIFLLTFIACLQKRFRKKAVESETMRLPLFMVMLVVGTGLGMVLATPWLRTGSPSNALPSLLLCSLGIPALFLLLDYSGIMEIDSVD